MVYVKMNIDIEEIDMNMMTCIVHRTPYTGERLDA